MTDDEILAIAVDALPEGRKGVAGTIVRRGGLKPTLAHDAGEDGALLLELEQLLGTSLPTQPPEREDCADVAFQEDTEVGRRTTVVQIRQGRVRRVIGQA